MVTAKAPVHGLRRVVFKSGNPQRLAAWYAEPLSRGSEVLAARRCSGTGSTSVNPPAWRTRRGGPSEDIPLQ